MANESVDYAIGELTGEIKSLRGDAAEIKSDVKDLSARVARIRSMSRTIRGGS